MALNPSTNATMAGRVTAADLDYPYGSSKNETAPGAGDGTPYFKARADDLFGFQQALLRAASIVPTGNADTARASQYFQALVELLSGRGINYDESGVADAYQLDAQSNQQLPAALFNGLTVLFVAGNTNTGACTAQLGALGAVSIKLRGGSVNPPAGAIRTAHINKLIYRTAPSSHWELDRTGHKMTTVVTATDAAWAYQPDVKTAKIRAFGAGGGGGGVDGQGAGTAAAGAGGASGDSCELTIDNPSGTLNITIGAAGSGGAAGQNAGSAGGNTTVVGTGVNMSAPGGGGGGGATAGSGVTGSAVAGAASNSASGGDLNLSGNYGLSGMVSGGDLVQLGSGGESILGGRTNNSIGDGNGIAAKEYGGGGGGGQVRGVATNFAGGDGEDGVVIVEEWL